MNVLVVCDISKPSPGAKKLAIDMARVIARAVVIMKRAKALPPTRPNLLISPNPHTPHIREKVTKGTTSIFNMLMNMEPTT